MKENNVFAVLFISLIVVLSASSLAAAKEKEKAIRMDKWVVPEISKNEVVEDYGLSAEIASAEASGSWTDYEVGPTIYTKNYWRFSPVFDSLSTTPTGATITYLSWSWSVINYPYGLLVYICDSNVIGCWNVSNFGSGGTTAFNGWPASTEFVMAFGVPGSGTLIPYTYGKNNRISVSWSP